MKKILASTAAALSVGLALSLVQAPMASAQQAPAIQTAQKSAGSVTLDQYRGRVGHRSYGHRNRGRIIGGIAAGIGTAIILNEIARPRYYYDTPTYYYSGGGLSCGQLEARCDAGQEWACRRLDRDPHC